VLYSSSVIGWDASSWSWFLIGSEIILSNHNFDIPCLASPWLSYYSIYTRLKNRGRKATARVQVVTTPLTLCLKPKTRRKIRTKAGRTVKDYVIRQTHPFWTSLFMGDLSEALILQSVATTLSFPNSPFYLRTHYAYYSIAASLGELVGRSYGVLLCACFEKDSTFVTRHTWIFSEVLVADIVFLIYAA
jgi:hypothetical protein